MSIYSLMCLHRFSLYAWQWYWQDIWKLHIIEDHLVFSLRKIRNISVRSEIFWRTFRDRNNWLHISKILLKWTWVNAVSCLNILTRDECFLFAQFSDPDFLLIVVHLWFSLEIFWTIKGIDSIYVDFACHDFYYFVIFWFILGVSTN